MQKRYNYRAYPTGQQQHWLSRSLGCARAVFNDFVAQRKQLWEQGHHQAVSFADTAQMVLLDAKADGGPRPYLAEVSATMLQQSLRDAQTAFTNFFKSVTGRRKGKRVNPPRLKTKHQHTQRMRFTRSARFQVFHQPNQKYGWVWLQKIGWVKIRMSRPLPSAPSSVTVTQWADGTFEVSFVVEVQPQPRPTPKHQAAGVDLGITDLAIVATDDGSQYKIANPRHLQRHQRKLARHQQALSRKKRGSKNRKKARQRVANQHRKVANARKDVHHKIARQLVDDTQALAVEDLNITGMVTNRKLAKAISDVGWGQLVTLLHEKAVEAGRTVTTIDRFYPSSQLCSHCGCSDGPKPLHIRTWQCQCCSTTHDRDINAATNIMIAAGLSGIENACGGSIRPEHALAEPVKQEPTEQTGDPHVPAA